MIVIHCLDDEEIVGEWLKDLFPRETYEVKIFSSPIQFIGAFSDKVDLVITDMKVPGYDLHTTLKHFKEIREGVYIIVISGYIRDNNFLIPLFPLGVSYVIEKTASGKDWLI